MYCRKCKEWIVSGSISGSSNNTSDVQWLSEGGDDNVVERITTMTPEMDKFFGTPPGLARSCVTLLGGAPGAGKTTLMLQLADCIIDQYKGCTLYIANEQSFKEIKSTALRLKIKNMDKIGFINAMGGFSHRIFELIHEYRPTFGVIDSLSKLVGGDLNLAVKVASYMKSISVELSMPSILINQVTKGMDHAGLEALQHEVDLTAMIYVEDDFRLLVSDKNRFGEAPISLELNMGASGLTVKGFENDESDEDSD